MVQNLTKQESNEALKILDWEIISREIAALAIFSTVKSKITLPPRATSKVEIIDQYDHLDSLLQFIVDERPKISDALSYIPDDIELFQSIEGFSKARVGTKDELNMAGLIIETALDLYKPLSSWTLLKRFQISDSEYNLIRRNFLRPLRNLIGKDGAIYYERHPELRPLFARLSSLEGELRETLDHTSRSGIYKDALQFDGHDLINDHYVIAVRADSYQGGMGQIISRSTTGLTLYVEPPLVRDRVNERFLLLSHIQEILQRIFTELSINLRTHFNSLILSRELIFTLDEYMAKSSYTINKRLIRPELSDNFEVEIFDFFHPLIKNPVKNSVTLIPGHLGLVISGPNTGGKTVALKSIAICHLFMHKGLFLPCRRATLFPTPNIYFLGHDRQSLSDGLSSFAAEVKNLLDLYYEIDESPSLIFVDEIFNSTSSDEASALAMSFINRFAANFRIKFLISTHHQLLKTLAYKRSDFLSAHVGYNIDEHKPTYKVFVGSPGDSLAFDILRNFKDAAPLSFEIADEASKMIESHAIDYRSLLNQLTEQSSILETKIIEQESINQKLREKENAHSHALKLEKEKLLNIYEKSLKGTLDKAEHLLDRTKRGEISSRNRLGEHSANLKKELTNGRENRRGSTLPLNHKPILISELKIGSSYQHLILNKVITIKSINEKKEEIIATSGNMSFKINANELGKLDSKNLKQDIKINFERETGPRFEIDCRGMRLEDFINTIQTEIAHLINGDIPYLSIIHGHGDGILKGWLRKFLKENPQFSYTIPDGNDGSTEIRYN